MYEEELKYAQANGTDHSVYLLAKIPSMTMLRLLITSFITIDTNKVLLMLKSISESVGDAAQLDLNLD